MLEGWIHFVNSRVHFYKLDEFILKENGVYVESWGLIKGTLIAKDGRVFGKEGIDSPVIMTNSLNGQYIRSLEETGVSPRDCSVKLGDIIEEQLEETEEKGLVIKNAEYLDYLEFLEYLDTIFSY